MINSQPLHQKVHRAKRRSIGKKTEKSPNNANTKEQYIRRRIEKTTHYIIRIVIDEPHKLTQSLCELEGQ